MLLLLLYSIRAAVAMVAEGMRRTLEDSMITNPGTVPFGHHPAPKVSPTHLHVETGF